MIEATKRRDEIRLSGVEVSTWVGVPEEERRLPQTLELDLVLIPTSGFRELGDELADTVDYEAVWRRVREVAAERPRKLIETLADELACLLLREFALDEVDLEIRKRILPGTQSVGVRVWRRSSTT